MSKSWPRLTRSTSDVLDVLLAASDDAPVYGLLICEQTDLGPGTVYPILERLAEIGWIEWWWEATQPSGRPRRRYYRLTGSGRAELAEARAALAKRRQRWAHVKPSAALGGAQ